MVSRENSSVLTKAGNLVRCVGVSWKQWQNTPRSVVQWESPNRKPDSVTWDLITAWESRKNKIFKICTTLSIAKKKFFWVYLREKSLLAMYFLPHWGNVAKHCWWLHWTRDHFNLQLQAAHSAVERQGAVGCTCTRTIRVPWHVICKFATIL
jgi:hypothetical protein